MISVDATGLGAGDGLLGLLANAAPGKGAGPAALSPFAQVLNGAIGQVPVLSMAQGGGEAEHLATMPVVQSPLPQPGKTLPHTLADGRVLPLPIMASLLSETPATALVENSSEGPENIADPASDPAPAIAVDMAMPAPPPPAFTPQPLPAATVAAQATIAVAPGPISDRLLQRGGVRQDDSKPTSNTSSMTAPAGVTLTVADLPVAAMAEPVAMPVLPSVTGVRQVSAPLFDLHPVGMPIEPAMAAPPPQQPQQPAMQDLTQIVERLAAAREAAAPATTRLAVDHAEFGPLSLSIEQGRTGELAIQVAAADSDSQAALVAAMAQADLPHFDNAPERRDTAPEREGAMSNRAGEERGQSAGRDRFAGQPQSQARPGEGQRDRRQQPAGHGEARTGTYA